MPKCPNCGQRTDGDFCQWCGYPIIGDNSVRQTQAKKETERVAEEGAMRETEEAKERAHREAKEARLAEAKTKREAEKAANERAMREAEETKKAKEAVNAEPYRGIVKLTIVSPIDLGQVRKLEECLHQVQDLRLVLVGGSVAEGSEVIVSAEKSIPLIDILREMPPVEQVVKKGKKIQIRLKPE